MMVRTSLFTIPRSSGMVIALYRRGIVSNSKLSKGLKVHRQQMLGEHLSPAADAMLISRVAILVRFGAMRRMALP